MKISERINNKLNKILPAEPYLKMGLKDKIYRIIFEADTFPGKLFDVILLIFITVSILILVLDSMEAFSPAFNTFLRVLEWLITIFFTIEYILRVYSSPNPRGYILSFYGIIDLISTLPLYISIVLPGASYLMIIRAFRLIRVFRIFRLFSFMVEGNVLLHALKDSGRKIFVFFLFVVILTFAIGTLMFIIEGNSGNPGFNNIPNSIYWTIVTLTTVGYGDITPTTGLGRFLSAIVMLLGYTIIAVPTGIVSASIMKSKDKHEQSCPHCGKKNDSDASFCKYCGQPIS